MFIFTWIFCYTILATVTYSIGRNAYKSISTLSSTSLCWEYYYESGDLKYIVQVLTDQLSLGEGPHWNSEREVLYFVDILGKSVHSYNPATKDHYSAVIKGDKYVSFIIPVEGETDKFIISTKTDISIISWDGKSSSEIEPEVVATFEAEENDRRINDGKADPKGRLWAGTMQITSNTSTYPPEGSLYSWTPDEDVRKHLEGVKLSNGLAWSLDNSSMYYTDLMKHSIFLYDYDSESGNITNERVFFNYTEHNMPGYPDGMTIDSEGNIFVASVGGSQILHLNGQTGELISEIDVPTKMVTSLSFGGENLNEIYVTSANIDDDFLPLPPNDTSIEGRLLRIIKLEFEGVPSMDVVY